MRYTGSKASHSTIQQAIKLLNHKHCATRIEELSVLIRRLEAQHGLKSLAV
jgi:hypothetical protein